MGGSNTMTIQSIRLELIFIFKKHSINRPPRVTVRSLSAAFAIKFLFLPFKVRPVGLVFLLYKNPAPNPTRDRKLDYLEAAKQTALPVLSGRKVAGILFCGQELSSD